MHASATAVATIGRTDVTDIGTTPADATAPAAASTTSVTRVRMPITSTATSLPPATTATIVYTDGITTQCHALVALLVLRRR